MRTCLAFAQLLLWSATMASATDRWLVDVAPPHTPQRLQELARQGVTIIHREEALVFGLASAARAEALAHDVTVLGPADDGREHFLLAPRHAEAVLPADARELGRYGERRLVALAPGAIGGLIDAWRPVRLFHRPVALAARPGPALPQGDAADPTIQGVVNGITLADYQAVHLDLYNNDGYGNRESTSAGGTNAQNKIRNLFLSYGYTDVTLFNVPGVTADNVVCRLNGATTPSQIYVIGGHYDTVSNTRGADDNASGSAGVLEAAKVIGQAYAAGMRFDSTIIFIAFAGEEWGLYGSDAWASWASSQGLDIRGMLNMDMIGYLDPGDAEDLDTIAESDAGSLALQNLALQVVADYLPGFSAIKQNSCPVKYQSDHASFWQQGYAAVFLFEDCNDYCPYIHTPGDTIGQGLNNFDFAIKNLKAATALLLELANPATAPPPAAAFTGAPLSGAAPLTVSFTDQSTGVVSGWSWTFGDGGTSAAQSPAHTYVTAGSFDVCLTVTGPSGSNQLCKPGYVTVSGGSTLPFELATGAGPGAPNPPLVKVWNATATMRASWSAYTTTGYGADVASGSFDGDAAGEHVTGPGPSPAFGPQVRGFDALGASVPKVNFYAYGTLRSGVNVALGDADADGRAEIATGAGPGVVFGPHVRGFDFDGVAVAPLPGLSFYAYQTLKYGANLAVAGLDAQPRADVLTGPGPGTGFGAQVRAFAYTGSTVTPLPGASFFAFAGYGSGVAVGAGDLAGDARREILAAPGPAPAHPDRVAAFAYDGSSVASLADFTAQATAYGGRVTGGDFAGDGRHEIVTAQGPDPATAASVTTWSYDAGTISAVPALTFAPFGAGAFGARLAAFDLGSY